MLRWFTPLTLVTFTISAEPAGFMARDHAFTNILQPAFEESCIECHGLDGKVKGDLNLLEFEDAESFIRNPERIQDLIDVLDFEDMPPADEAPLAIETRSQMIDGLRSLFTQAIAAKKGFPETPIRRMNRFQYNNAVQDLFALNREIFALPERMAREYGNYFRPATGLMPDTLKVGSRPLGKSQLIDKRLAGVVPFPQDLRAEHGFDNQADHLSLSPLLLESFLQLSSSIVHSDDFNRENCGIWDTFFAPPPDATDLKDVIRERLRPFLDRAFRRQVSDLQLDRYASHVHHRIQKGDTFTDGMKAAASAALASPNFLYLYDRSAHDQHTDYALASRLSFFLWGSLPDADLLALAAAGELHHPDTLSLQVDRMLADPKLKRFCDSFPSQWLQLERIISSVPDRDLHPDFYFAKFRVSMHMMLEPLLLFETILVENRPILELIDSDFSYRSNLLQNWYQQDSERANRPPAAIPFQRVALDDRRQGGVITTAAAMTMTSNPTRTQPITRGAWIASVVFNDPPEPPPANVPALPETEETAHAEIFTLRERFEAHRSKAECAGCHSRIDPLGFALENYGPTGLWRDHYESGLSVDPSGTLFRKYPFDDIIGFKDAILAEKDRFTRAFASHLLAFALGRKTSIEDSPTLDQITAAARQDDYAIQTLIRQVILSESFLHKPSPPSSDLAAYP